MAGISLLGAENFDLTVIHKLREISQWVKDCYQSDKFDLIEQYKTNYHYKILHSQAAQQILLSVGESFKSYKGLIKAYKKGEITDKPRIPNYRKKGGLAIVSYPKQALKLKDNQIRVPLGKTCKRWFGKGSFYIPMPSNLNFKDIKELRILPRNKCFYWEFVYKREIKKVGLNSNNVLGIDPGYLIQEINNKQQQQRCIFFTQCNDNLLHKFIYIE